MAEIATIIIPADEWQELKTDVKQTKELLSILSEQTFKKYLTVKEAAELLKCSVGTIHRYIANGDITVKSRTAKRQKILIPAAQIAARTPKQL